ESSPLSLHDALPISGSGDLAYAGLLRWELQRAQPPHSLEHLEAVANDGVRRYPESIELHWLRGQIQMRAAKYNEAIASFQTLISDRKSTRLNSSHSQ